MCLKRTHALVDKSRLMPVLWPAARGALYMLLRVCLHGPVQPAFSALLTQMPCAESQALCNSSSWRPQALRATLDSKLRNTLALLRLTLLYHFFHILTKTSEQHMDCSLLFFNFILWRRVSLSIDKTSSERFTN